MLPAPSIAAFQQGLKWCGIYWEKLFVQDIYSVNVALIPLVWVERVENDPTIKMDFVDLLAMRSAGISNLDRYHTYQLLWNNAFIYYINVRKNIRRARIYSEIAMNNLEESRINLAYLSIRQAYLIELSYSPKVVYWKGLYLWIKKSIDS